MLRKRKRLAKADPQRKLPTTVECVQCHAAHGCVERTCEACQRQIEIRIELMRAQKQPEVFGERRDYERPRQRVLRSGTTSSSDKRRGRLGYAM